MSNNYGVGSANGKIILMGEHAVVYGEPSVAIPFPATKVTTLTTPAETETMIECEFYRGLLKDMPELLESLKKAIELSLAATGQPEAKLDFKIFSTIPAERGMGSSAAVAVATTRSIFDFYQVKLTQTKLLEIVGEAEKIAHGNPSGLDAIMTSSSIPYAYVRGEAPLPLELNLKGVLVVADTGQTGQTKEAVASVSAKIASQTEGENYRAKISALGALATTSQQALKDDDALSLGEKMRSAHQLLAELGVSSPELDRLVTAALDANALGAKLTGGGRGGCMIALAKDYQAAEKIAQALKNNGAKSTWLYEMSE